MFKNEDTVTGGTGAFEGATGFSKTFGIARTDPNVVGGSNLVFVFTGKIST